MRKKCVYYTDGICRADITCPYKYQYYQKQQCKIGGLEKPTNRMLRRLENEIKTFHI